MRNPDKTIFLDGFFRRSHSANMRLALAFAFALPAYAGDLQSVNAHYNQSIHYKDYTGWDFRALPNGGEGNCATIAFNKWKALQWAYGDRAEIRTCYLWTGEAHAFVIVDGKWALDNRHSSVVKTGDVDCQTIMFTAIDPKAGQRPSLKVSAESLAAANDPSL